jgi:hypothetical protein
MNEIRRTIYSDLILLNIKENMSNDYKELGITEEEYKRFIEENEELGYLKNGIVTVLGFQHLREKYINFV